MELSILPLKERIRECSGIKQVIAEIEESRDEISKVYEEEKLRDKSLHKLPDFVSCEI